MEKSEFMQSVEELALGYVANDSVKSDLSKIELIAIIGPTGVGKTAILDKLNLNLVMSDVTREKRPDEKGEKNYHFRNDYTKILDEIKAGEYIQFLVSRSKEFYGTHRSAYPALGKCSMAIVAEAIDSFRQLGFRKIIPIFIMPPGYVEWMRRVGSNRHGDIHERIEESIQSIKIAIKDPEYKFVLNDNLELAVRDVKKIIAGEPVDEHRTRLARETADILLERLGDQDDDNYFMTS